MTTELRSESRHVYWHCIKVQLQEGSQEPCFASSLRPLSLLLLCVSLSVTASGLGWSKVCALIDSLMIVESTLWSVQRSTSQFTPKKRTLHPNVVINLNLFNCQVDSTIQVKMTLIIATSWEICVYSEAKSFGRHDCGYSRTGTCKKRMNEGNKWFHE